MTMDKSNDFEINRLIEQAKCWEPEAETLFDLINIHPGWKCIDLGCGPMGVLGSLSRRVGAQGQVTGLDHNPNYIQSAKSFINLNRLANVSVIQGDLFSNSLKPHFYDLCHMRFVFSQIGCDQELLEKTIALTRPGGVLISQESDWTTWNCYPPLPAWEKIRNSMTVLFNHLGGDINAGLRTYQMFNTAGLADVQIRTAILAMPVGHPYRSGFVRFAMTLREKILADRILTEAEFAEAIAECNEANE